MGTQVPDATRSGPAKAAVNLQYDFTICKGCKRPSGRPTYRLRNATTLYVCRSCGFHYIDYLDRTEDGLAGTPDPGDDERHFQYIENVLESSRERFAAKLAAVQRLVALPGALCLDVGAGGGLFMHLLAQEGAEVAGIEPHAASARFAAKQYGFEMSSEPVESPHWQRGFLEHFDLVTLWDVLEHVNFPVETVGVLCIDTPVRDSLLHRSSEAAYRMTRGRVTLFFNMLYSSISFGHKQILSCAELRDLSRSTGLEVVGLQRFHELSFPIEVYMAHLLRSKRAARTCTPLAQAFFSLCRIRNKALLAARKLRLQPDESAVGA
jgi:SAM-dependent methyltransferase